MGRALNALLYFFSSLASRQVQMLFFMTLSMSAHVFGSSSAFSLPSVLNVILPFFLFPVFPMTFAFTCFTPNYSCWLATLFSSGDTFNK